MVSGTGIGRFTRGRSRIAFTALTGAALLVGAFAGTAAAHIPSVVAHVRRRA